MVPSPAALRVLFKQIDFDDATFSLIPWPETMVAGSMARARSWILQPPLLRSREGGRFQVVAGRGRLLAARQEGAASCLCLVLAPETPEPETLAMALEAALASGPLSPVMRALFLRKAQLMGGRELPAPRYLPLLGLPTDTRLDDYCRLLELEEPLLLALHAGTLAERTAVELAELPFADRLALYEVIDLLRPSVSNQRKLLEGCRELALREQCSILDLLAEPAAREILAHPSANPPQKAAGLMAWLAGRRFPRLSSAEEDFRRFVRGLDLPAGATLTHIPAFEQDAVTLSVTFPDRQSFAAAWGEIEEAIRSRISNDQTIKRSNA